MSWIASSDSEIIDCLHVQIEQALIDKWNGFERGNVSISVHKNSKSSSKAENVNYGLTLLPQSVEYVAIMDADHQPHQKNASAAAEALITRGLDIVQGSCTIRNGDNILSWIISIEFEDMYNVGHQGELPRFVILMQCKFCNMSPMVC